MTDTQIARPSEPFSKQILDYITAYVNCQDLEQAAVAAGFQPEMGRILYKRALVRAEIDRRLEAVNGEVHKEIARKRIVTVEALDKSLMQVVKLTHKDVLASPTLAASKVKAIELGYQRTGIMIDGNFIPDAGSDIGKPEELPRIFRGTERTIITHQITETRETVQTRDMSTAGSRPVSPPTIEAEPQDDPWKNF